MSPRMSLSTIKILLVMLKDPESTFYGLELSKQSGVSIGSMYPILVRLEKAGWLSSKDEEPEEFNEGRPPRRYYQLTPDGTVEARSEIQRHGIKLPRMRLRHA